MVLRATGAGEQSLAKVGNGFGGVGRNASFCHAAKRLGKDVGDGLHSVLRKAGFQGIEVRQKRRGRPAVKTTVGDAGRTAVGAAAAASRGAGAMEFVG